MSSCFFSPKKKLLRKKHLPHRKTQKPPYLHSVILKNEAKIKKMHVFLHFSSEKFCQFKKKQYLCTRFRKGSTNNPGAVVQLVRISACHAGGRGCESRPHRKSLELRLEAFCVCGRRTRTLPQGPPKISDFGGKEEQRGIDGAVSGAILLPSLRRRSRYYLRPRIVHLVADTIGVPLPGPRPPTSPP